MAEQQAQVYTGLDRIEAGLAFFRSALYTFVAEVSPGTWKVQRKEDGAQYLARDITSHLQNPDGSPTTLQYLLDPRMHNLKLPLTYILNHENLINFVDWVQNRHTSTGLLGFRPINHYMLWDFCNAGTLENLFVPEKLVERASDGSPEQAFEVGATDSASNVFLPESLCWHVMVSVLRALTWLHHGIRDHYNAKTNRYEKLRADVDWQTILHRNITPVSIFFCHPLHGETYGLCKLGDFSKAFVSGHVNGILRDVVPPAYGKVLAGDDGHVSLHELRMRDASLQGKCWHPPLEGQPYSIISEYRALGVIILAMMVKPVATGNEHVGSIRNLSLDEWWSAFHAAEYSKEIKNQLYRLMSIQDVRFESTYRLLCQAKKGFAYFRMNTPEGRDVEVIEDVIRTEVLKQQADEILKKRENEHAQEILQRQDKAFAKLTKQQQSLVSEMDAWADSMSEPRD